IFGGATLKDFAFAMMVGVASGAYSSIFIATPVLTHWKEREPTYRARRARLVEEMGRLPTFPEENVVARLGGEEPVPVGATAGAVAAAEAEPGPAPAVTPEPVAPAPAAPRGGSDGAGDTAESPAGAQAARPPRPPRAERQKKRQQKRRRKHGRNR
ncbi:MAG: hypothetical protein ACRDK1_07555, partial [Solirubrobacterales bacterium]